MLACGDGARMRQPVWEYARARAAPGASVAGLSTYQLTLFGLQPSAIINGVFNLLAAASLALLGHPLAAAVAFVTYCGIDIVNHRVVRRLLAASEGVGPKEGSRKLVAICAARVSVYLAPTVAVAVSGHAGELLLFTVQACTLLAVAHSSGMLSRAIYWSFVSPILAAAVGVAATVLSPVPAAAVLLSLAAFTALLGLMVEGTLRTMSALGDAFNANAAMIPQLETARDQAVAERTAADEAREVARQASQAKSNFLATMSHEIRTPMNGVLGMAQLLQRDEADPVQKARLEVLIESGDYLLGILNDILDVSKIDAGRLDILPAAEDLPAFLERLVRFWGPRADEKGVALSLDMRSGLPAFALIDALRLRQVLFNVMGNALKFTEQGTVAVTAEATPNGAGAVLLHVSVRDTGIGIADEHLPQLFARFTQGDESEIRKFGGTGLGLSIAKQLIELMGGEIWAESALGQGSTFHINLPLALADAPAAGVPESPAVDDAVAPAGLSILAVDDNAVNLMVLDQLLSSFGHDIVKATGGAEALAAMAGQPFDLVLMDIQMPGMSGIEVLHALRAAEGPNRDAPVMALTADVTSGGRQRYLQLGFTEHSAKPIQIQDLMEAIARALAATPVGAREDQAA